MSGTPKNFCVDEVRRSLRNVQDLKLEVRLNKETYDRLFTLMPNITSLHVLLTEFRPFLSILRKLEWKLVKLEILGTPINGEEMTELANLYSSTIQELSILLTQDHKEDSFAAISNFTELRVLALDDASNFSNRVLKQICVKAPHAYHSRWNGPSAITATGVSHIMKLRCFRDFSLTSWLDSDDIAWHEAWRCMGDYMNTLTIRFDFKYRDDLLQKLAKSKSLRASEVSVCGSRGHKTLRFYQAAGFEALTVEKRVGSHKFTEISYVECENLTDKEFAEIVLHYPQLETLFLNRCNKITDAGVGYLLTHETHLQKLYLNAFPQLSERTLCALSKTHPLLRVQLL